MSEILSAAPGFRCATRLPAVGRHVNRAPCLLIGAERAVRVRLEGRVVAGETVLVGPGVAHEVWFGAQEARIVFFDRALWPVELGAPALRLAGAAEQDLAARCAESDGGGEAFAAAAQELLARAGLAPLHGAAVGGLAEALDAIDADPMARMGQEELARRLGCERTRALRRFKAATGLTFRAYKQWRGLSAAAAAVIAGAPAGAAALDAGFADPSHFSRSFRAVFGVAPREAAAGTRLA